MLWKRIVSKWKGIIFFRDPQFFLNQEIEITVFYAVEFTDMQFKSDECFLFDILHNSTQHWNKGNINLMMQILTLSQKQGTSQSCV